MDLKGSKTEKNLQTAFAGESQAHTKYQYYASAAKKEGYNQIGAIFTETAGNEKEHAKLWAKALEMIGDTAANLQSAISGENYENQIMYPKMAEEAEEEGHSEIAEAFRKVGEAEKAHEARYRQLFTADEMGRKWTELYQELLEEKSLSYA